ncbi:hypothetical protein EDB92DRAFT_1466460 [Lactarius akahatsu]|uniref:Uncharacterized protein n=1 Tax=Lactarius akahatsu TaxID=416441 RepID=A0AAD4L8Q7_9AGAM|nr:hypothetical protein EDB92DRAFT_1466460 [Lactarius akahatsu]
MRVIESSSSRRQFAFTILCDLASARKTYWMLQCPSNFSRIPTSLSSLFWYGFKRRYLGQRTSRRDPSCSTRSSSVSSPPIRVRSRTCSIRFQDMLPLDADRDRHREGAVLPTRLIEAEQQQGSCEAEPAVHSPRRLRRAPEPRAAHRVLRHTRGGCRAPAQGRPPLEVPTCPRARPRRRDALRGAPPATRLISARRRPRLARARWTTHASRALALAWPLARRADSRRACMLATSRGGLASARDGVEQRHDSPSVRYVLYYGTFSLSL